MADIKIAIMGAGGRMGRTLTRVAHQLAGCVVVGGIEPNGSEFIGQDMGMLAGIGELGVTISDDALELFTKSDVILDFTIPSASVFFAELAAQLRITHVIGSTGFSEEQDAQIEAAAQHATIIKSGNMSLGVNLLMAMVKKTAAALGEDFDIEVVEMHHRNKIDAPSGTALMLGQAAADGRKIDLAERSIRGRDGITGVRPVGDIGFATLRGGTVIGEHSVIFAGPDERIELSHIANDRAMFANGALKAAIWGATGGDEDKSKVMSRGPGLFTMFDVLGIEDI
ncbi:MAG: 4-hydroxy-tetrahydrodipicolinate reductase [Hyphomicrobiales bacterium]|nr:4-hydroxy-tetrahydrodipicolinate reductase [Hyphomicrobiales bacterium]